MLSFRHIKDRTDFVCAAEFMKYAGVEVLYLRVHRHVMMDVNDRLQSTLVTRVELGPKED